MPEPDLIQQQRTTLRDFRQASAMRAQAEVEAESRYKAECAAADAVLNQVRRQPDEQLEHIRNTHNKAKDVLRKWHEVLADIRISPTPSHPSNDPVAEARLCASRADEVLKTLKDCLSPVVEEGGIQVAQGPPHVSAWPFYAFVFFVGAVFLLIFAGPLGVSSCALSAILLLLGAGFFAGYLAHRSTVAKIRRLYGDLLQALQDAEYWSHRWLELAHLTCQPQHAEAWARYQQTKKIAVETFHSRTAQLHPAFVILATQSGLLSPTWNSSSWQDWAPAKAISSANRVGDLQVGMDGLTLPSLLLIIGGRGALFEAREAGKPVAAQAIQSLLLRLLASIPPGKLRFTFVDPIALGDNVSCFMQLADYDEMLVTAKAWTEPAHIEARLAELTEHMENVIQRYLRNDYASIEAYNAHAGEVAEPYRVLAVFDFPANFTEAAARRLVSIAQNGPRCGVYALVLRDTEKPLPYGFNVADLEAALTTFTWDGKRFAWQDRREDPAESFQNCLLELDALPEKALGDHIIEAVGKGARSSDRVQVSFERMFELFEMQREQSPEIYPGLPGPIVPEDPSTWWSGETSAGIVAPLGRSGARGIQCLSLGKDTQQHILVAGRTGSGKSTLFHTMIAGLALAYSPEEIELYLVDLKEVEFRIYARGRLPHARVIASKSEREFALSVLQGLAGEMERRKGLFAGAAVRHIAAYRAKAGSRLPRILLVVDEFQELFREDDAVNSQAASILDQLARQGRAFGIHVMLASQTLAGAYTIHRSTMGQMAVRIALQCDEADSRLILADDNAEARLLSRPGEAIYNDKDGLAGHNSRFQAAMLADDHREEEYLQAVLEMARRKRYAPPKPQVIFDGDALASLEPEQEHPLNDLLARFPQGAGDAAAARKAFAWLGEPIAIRDPLAAAFRRQSGSNLLIVGQSDEAALGAIAVALVSLSAQLPPAGAMQGPVGESLLVLDFGATDAPHADYLSRVAVLLPQQAKVGRRRQLAETIDELAAEVQRRLDADETSAPPKYLFVYGLQRARDLRQDEGLGFASFGEEPSGPNLPQQFAAILRDGPDVGVHTIVWCDTLTNLNRALDRRSLREFAMRAVFQMTAEDSANLIDTPAASKLGPNRALFYDEEAGRLEKFRPYGLPSEEWLAWAGEQLRRSTPAG